MIELIKGYHCAPQVFYFTPRRKWYLIYQSAPFEGLAFFGPVYSTIGEVGKPQTLTPPAPLFRKKPANVKHGSTSG